MLRLSNLIKLHKNHPSLNSYIRSNLDQSLKKIENLPTNINDYSIERHQQKSKNFTFDYRTNIPLRYSKQLKIDSCELADEIISNLDEDFLKNWFGIFRLVSFGF